MDEEKKAAKIIEKKAGDDSEAGNKSSANSIVERADAAAERLEKATQEYQAAIRRQEELMAKQALGGRSTITQPVEKKEDTNAEFKAKFLRNELENPFK